LTLENKSANIASGVTINALRFALALVFAFSGFVKAVDPMGTVYKMADYADAFGLTMHPWMLLLGAWLLIIVEYVMGVALFFGLYRRFYLWLMIAFLGVMTPLTLVLALTNPVSDCGCFGDALVLTNWQTFGKNVVLLLMAIVVLRCHKRIWRVISERTQWLIFVYALVAIAVFMRYNMRHLPVLDFRPYAIGTNLIEGMTIPEDAPQDEYETLFVLEKDGEQRTFTFDDYPDSTWTFVKRESRLVRQGYVPPIADFHLSTLEGEDVTWEVLDYPGYTFLVVSHELRRANEGMLDVINDLYDYAKVGGHQFYMLTSSNAQSIAQWTERTGASYPYLNADDILLKTMVRANPGLIVLKEATIVGKWSAIDMPRDEQLSVRIEDNAALTVSSHETAARRVATVFWMLFPLLLLVAIDRVGGKSRG
jgi:uncharacterized membrane protein YphA (DoxX/SURF4 family)